ncbi:conserved protein of unknown function [Tenacibaculum sp. 190130A14a]|uniref:Secreted protein n=1 Tax=Tenacibaculum polynesiense TaxID=3137857 RepID=A0ABP1F0R0_9FLAO
MKQVFHKIISFVMAIMVLLSTVSFTIDMHYCGDTLVDTAIFKKAKNCGMNMKASTSNSNSECSVTKKNCCTDKQVTIDGQDELKVSHSSLSFDQQVFIASFVYTYINLFESVEEDKTLYRLYKPPLVVKEIYKLDETYLI